VKSERVSGLRGIGAAIWFVELMMMNPIQSASVCSAFP
jgi:hypothetical protein